MKKYENNLNGKEWFFSNNHARITDYPYAKKKKKKIKFVPYLAQYTKINSKWNRDPNVKPKIMKLLEKKYKRKCTWP